MNLKLYQIFLPGWRIFFSGNGDFLSFVIKGKEESNPNYGPVITQATDFNLFQEPDKKERLF